MMVCNNVEYQAIFETETHIVYVQYEPSQNGEIFITDVHIQPRPVTLFEFSRRREKQRRGLVLDEQEEHAEAVLPATRLEQMKLFES